MKLKTVLLAATLILSVSAVAFAQNKVTFSVGSTPVTAIRDDGVTERVGAVTFTVISSAGIPAGGTIRVNFGVPITVPTGVISVTGSGSCATTSLNATETILTSGVVVINVPAACTTVNNVIVLDGVRVAPAGTTLTVLDATISATGDVAIQAGQTVVRVVNSVAEGIASCAILGPTVTTTGTVVTVTANASAPAGFQGVIRITENFVNAFQDATQEGTTVAGFNTATTNTNVSGSNFKIVMTGTIPSGMTLTFPATFTSTINSVSVTVATTNADGTLDTDGVSFTNTSSLTAWFGFTAGPSLTAVDTIQIPYTLTSTVSFTGSVTATAALSPVTTTFTSTTGQVPRFREDPKSCTGAIVAGAVTFNNTALLFPHVSVVRGALAFDTGIAIANVSAMPATAPLPAATAQNPQAGTITLHFFRTTGATFSVTRTAAVPAGGSDVFLVGTVLTGAGITGDFQGHVIAITNFSDAHGVAFVFDPLAHFAQGYLGLVMNPATIGTALGFNN